MIYKVTNISNHSIHILMNDLGTIQTTNLQVGESIDIDIDKSINVKNLLDPSLSLLKIERMCL